MSDSGRAVRLSFCYVAEEVIARVQLRIGKAVADVVGEAVGSGDEGGDVGGCAVGVEGLHDAAKPMTECCERLWRHAEDRADACDGDGLGQFRHQVEFGLVDQSIQRRVHDAGAFRLEAADAGVQRLYQRTADTGVFRAIQLQHRRALVIREGEAIWHSGPAATDRDCGGFGLVRVLAVRVVREKGAGVGHAGNQPCAAGLVAMQRASAAQLSKARVGVRPGGKAGGSQVDNAERAGTTVGHIPLPCATSDCDNL